MKVAEEIEAGKRNKKKETLKKIIRYIDKKNKK